MHSSLCFENDIISQTPSISFNIYLAVCGLTSDFKSVTIADICATFLSFLCDLKQPWIFPFQVSCFIYKNHVNTTLQHYRSEPSYLLKHSCVLLVFWLMVRETITHVSLHIICYLWLRSALPIVVAEVSFWAAQYKTFMWSMFHSEGRDARRAHSRLFISVWCNCNLGHA